MSGRYQGRRKRRRKRLYTPIFIGILILIVAAVLFVRGISNSKSAAPPDSTSVISNVSPSPVPSPKPSASQATMTVNGIEYKTLTEEEDAIYQGKLILVNSEHPFKFNSVETFVNIAENISSSYKAAYNDISASKDTLAPLNAMFDAFYSNTGLKNVYIISGFRSFERQQELFKAEVADKGETEAAKWVAVPGTSEHHTGLAIDLGLYDANGNYMEFDGSGKYAWIDNNSYKFGFIVRYNDSKRSITKIYREPWHFRFVGVAHATEITKLGLCLEEYVDYIRSYTYDKPLEIKTDDGRVYHTYFCKGLDVIVPKDGIYEISGNNVDGFIVTVNAA